MLRAAFRHVRAHHPFTIEAAVILPDHLHAIWTLPEHDADFALRHDRLGFIVQSLLQTACIFLVAGRLAREL